MTQIRLSYEEQILNALSRLTKKKGLTTIQWMDLQFDAIREVLKPLYKQTKELEAEKQYHQSRQIAICYAGLLKERLHEIKDTLPPEFTTSVHHLIWMCKQIIEHTGYVPKEWSITKLHRWIGYIQGVMTARAFTTVEQERNDYRELKNKILAELGLESQDV